MLSAARTTHTLMVYLNKERLREIVSAKNNEGESFVVHKLLLIQIIQYIKTHT
jgi:hypothetical protein